jgi:hypothetical protein
MLDKVQDTSIIEFVDDDLENIMATEVNDINELASMLASVGMDEDDEAVLDMLYAEHEARMNALLMLTAMSIARRNVRWRVGGVKEFITCVE